MVTRNGRKWVFRALTVAEESVHVVGDFNHWDSVAAPMSRSGWGEWTTSLELEPGAYRFRYLVDGRRWLTDYAAFGLIRNRLGEWDSVIYVPLPRVIHPTPKSMDNVPLDMPADSNDELIDTDGWARAIRKVGMGI